MPKTNIVGQIVSEILAQFVWSHQNITGLISQRQFTLQWQVGLLGVFLSECPDESLNFTNLIFMTSQFSTLFLYPVLFSLRRSRVELVTFLTKDKNVRTSQALDFLLITTSKSNFSEMHTSWPTPRSLSNLIHAFHYSKTTENWNKLAYSFIWRTE